MSGRERPCGIDQLASPVDAKYSRARIPAGGLEGRRPSAARQIQNQAIGLRREVPEERLGGRADPAEEPMPAAR
jgi:hypothetical protein